MNKQIYILGIFFLLIMVSCGKVQKSNNIEKIKLSFEIVPEDYKTKSYSIEWGDTLCKSKGYDDINRPMEIKCVIRNKKNDILGYYRGLSTPMTFTYFQTKDTIIYVDFSIDCNAFSGTFKTGEEVERYIKKNKLPIKFKSIELNINKDLRKKFSVELEKK